MKILIVQLLRLGDILISSPVIQGLRDQHPNCEIDLLMNRQFESVVSLLPKIDHCFFFDRNEIQSSLGEKSRFVFEAFDRVDSLVADLQDRQYDSVINLTHNKLSAYIVGAINCTSRVGLWFDDTGRPQIESAWFEHLDLDQKKASFECFHFVDVYKGSVGIDRPRLGISLQSLESLKSEKTKRQTGASPQVVIQALTSDSKKNWGLKRFISCVELINESIPGCRFIILGAPSEEKLLQEAFIKHPLCQILICDLPTAYQVISNSDLLITGDTSIKHLAASTATPIIELSMGSSEFRRTGCYSENAIIIQSNEECAPCTHSLSCHRSQHFCSSRISPDLVSLVAFDLIRNKSLHLRAIAEEFSDEAKIFRVDIQSTGTWMAIDATKNAPLEQMLFLIRKFATKLFIQQRSNEKNVFEVFGSESEKFQRLLNQIYRETATVTKNSILENLEKSLSSYDTALEVIETQYYHYRFAKNSNEKCMALLRELRFLTESIDPSEVIQNDQCTTLKSEDSLFVNLRKVQMTIRDLKLRSQIELKLVRSLQINLQKDVEV